jgi:hypothetical protein
MEAHQEQEMRPNGPLILAAAAGIVCRVAQYAAHQSAWIDEASLLLNIRSHTAGQLFGPLDYNQAAPPLFLLAERALYLTFGASEFSLRLLPVCCGIASVVIFALLARRVLERPWDAIATAAYALGDRLIWHSCEVKQYGTDVMIAVLLIYLAIGPRADWSGTRRLVAVAIVAAFAAWFSYTTMLVFPAIAAALFPRRGKGATVAPFVAGCALAGISFLAIVRYVIPAQQTQSLTATWQGDFVDLRRFWEAPWWLVRHLHSMCNYPIAGAGPVVMLGLAAGASWLWRSGKLEELFILGGPILVALLAAVAHRYPFDGSRLTCFLSGPALLLAVIGLRWIYLGTIRFGRPVAAAPAAFVLGIAIIPAAMHLVAPRNRGHVRQVVTFVREHMQPKDEIYVLNEQRLVLWYWPACEERARWGLEPENPAPGRRFWIVWSFGRDGEKRRDEAVVRWAEGFAVRRDQVQFRDCGAALMGRKSG